MSLSMEMPPARAQLEAIARKLMLEKQFHAPATFALCFIDAVLDSPEALDRLCEYRARQINAEADR